MNAEDDPNATLASLLDRAWQLEKMKRQRDESVGCFLTEQAIRQRIETLKRELNAHEVILSDPHGGRG